MAATPFVSIKGVTKSFKREGKRVETLRNVNLELREGEFVVLFGPNGCGKTTLLYIVAGLEKADAGSVCAAGRCSPPTVGFVFQNFHESLFPYRTVAENVEFALQAKGVEREERREVALKWLRKVGLDGHAHKYPYELSGGMRQLVALARAWAFDPLVMLMDEPFSALDYSTRARMEEEVLRIWAEKPKTTLFVSHDIDEAVFLADRVVVLSKRPASVRKIIEVDLPRPRRRSMLRDGRFFELRNEVINAFEGEAV